ncbi:hypothetical protein E2C01_042194 [Portunus trituberculatus]|uniref:Uncharacterized protein n=1 Tax=Portunus trituberculatus TaxID=210409 RepID=A0A5B7FPJ7_PORTR|nr:hypothetical protein [Portunus trituberculatus]
MKVMECVHAAAAICRHGLLEACVAAGCCYCSLLQRGDEGRMGERESPAAGETRKGSSRNKSPVRHATLVPASVMSVKQDTPGKAQQATLTSLHLFTRDGLTHPTLALSGPCLVPASPHRHRVKASTTHGAGRMYRMSTRRQPA